MINNGRRIVSYSRQGFQRLSSDRQRDRQTNRQIHRQTWPKVYTTSLHGWSKIWSHICI